MTRHKRWPRDGRALRNALRRLAPTLRAVGVQVEHGREPHTGRRLVTLTTTPTPAGTPQTQGRVQGRI